MTFVNSKLSVSEKDSRKQWLTDIDLLGGLVMSFPEYQATVAFMPEFENSRMMLVSISFAEYRETKFKRKVGEYHALRRMFLECEYIKVPSVCNTWVTDTWDTDSVSEYQAEWAANFAASLVL